MKKHFRNLLVFILFILAGLVSTSAHASMPAEGSHLCNASGTINSVESLDLPDYFGGESYRLDVRIDSVSEPTLETKSKYYTDSGDYVCVDMYPVNSVHSISVKKSELEFLEAPMFGAKISGVVFSSFYGSSAPSGEFYEVDIRIPLVTKVIMVSIIFGVFLGLFLLIKRYRRNHVHSLIQSN